MRRGVDSDGCWNGIRFSIFGDVGRFVPQTRCDDQRVHVLSRLRRRCASRAKSALLESLLILDFARRATLDATTEQYRQSLPSQDSSQDRTRSILALRQIQTFRLAPSSERRSAQFEKGGRQEGRSILGGQTEHHSFGWWESIGRYDGSITRSGLFARRNRDGSASR